MNKEKKLGKCEALVQDGEIGFCNITKTQCGEIDKRNCKTYWEIVFPSLIDKIKYGGEICR